jgi:periplasmic protein TonB
MSPELRSVSEVRPKESLGSLSGCLVDGDAEQCTRQRRVKRRAVAISVFLQSAVLAVLILVPLFSKAERISLTIVTPLPPYSRYRDASHKAATQPPHPHGPQNPCRFCAPPNIPPTIVMRDPSSSATETNEDPIDGQNIPGGIDGAIPLSDLSERGPKREDVETRAVRPQIVHVTRIDPAMLVHRVEPTYPSLAKATHREGRVEMRAVIGTDGTIQSLQIVSGDPLFYISAREAVEQWLYKPTVLNGKPVEIDTFITVVYTMQH